MTYFLKSFFLSLLDVLSNILLKEFASSIRQAHFCLHGKGVVIKGKEGWREELKRREVFELKSLLNTESGSHAGILHQ